MKRLLSLLLSVILVMSICPAVLASNTEHKAAADILYSLGLVSGTGTDASGNPIYELDRAPTRSEAITVLVKLLGKADEAGKGGWSTPFTDVPGWAQNFVGYAYANGLTAGTSATTFGGDDLVTASQYITFVLKALGYSANGDFQWDKAWELSDKLGITDGRYNASTNTFLRGDVFLISEAALKIKVKGSEQTLAERLISAGAFTQTQYDNVYDVKHVLTAQEISEKCAPAVFFIEVYALNGELCSTGSGFFISETGLAVTNYHVVANAYQLVIKMADGTICENVKILDGDKDNDLALLRVEGSGFSYLEMGDSDILKQGQQVYAFGSPFGLENTMSQGIISNPKRMLETEYIQISVPIDHGSSGGALVDQYGSVVGVTSAGFESSADLNLAIPINRAKALEMDSTSNLILFDHEYYPGFEYACDFGVLSGVKLIDCFRMMPLYYVFVYDLFDFHATGNMKGSAHYAASSHYYNAVLQDHGLTQTVVIDPEERFFGRFENDKECVVFGPDYENNWILVIASRKPVFYAELPMLLDLGWFLGLKCEGAKTIDRSQMYSYNWIQEYNESELINELELYVEYLEDNGMDCVYKENGRYLCEGNGLSAGFGIFGEQIIVDVAPL